MKLFVPLASAFDLVASMPRIWPLARLKADQSLRVGGSGKAVLPPGGARLANIRCQRFGSPSQTRLWSDSRARFDFRQGIRCTATHP